MPGVSSIDADLGKSPLPGAWPPKLVWIVYPPPPRTLSLTPCHANVLHIDHGPGMHSTELRIMEQVVVPMPQSFGLSNPIPYKSWGLWSGVKSLSFYAQNGKYSAKKKNGINASKTV